MHKNQQIALEFIEKNPNPTMKQLSEFTQSKDLKTLIRIMLAQDFSLFSKDSNKNDLTDFDKIQAIDEYSEYPEIFLNFCSLDLFTIERLFYTKKTELAKMLLDNYILESNNYIQELVDAYIFEKEYPFLFQYYFNPESIDEFVLNLEPLILDIKNIHLKDDNLKKKMLFFYIDEYLSSKNPNVLMNIKNDIVDRINDFKELSIFKKMTNDEIFKMIMPSYIEVNGTYIFYKNSVQYKISKNLFNYIEQRILLSIDRLEKAKTESNKKNLETTISGLSLASAFFIPPLAVKLATSKAIMDLLSGGKDIVESVNNIKDMVEFSKGYIGDFLNLDNTKELYKQYLESNEKSFKDFFIELLKKEINFFVFKLIKQEVAISDSVFEDIYNQFIHKQVYPIYESLLNDKEFAKVSNEQTKHFNEYEMNEYILNVLFESKENGYQNRLI